MKITVLGTGMVGQALSAKLSALGHEVTMGTRNPSQTISRNTPSQMTGTSFAEWYKKNRSIKISNFASIPEETELFINALSGKVSLEVLTTIAEKLAGKILVDVANPLDFSKGMPPTLFICNEDSLGEAIQRNFPDTRVVKTLNTMNAELMVNPSMVPSDHCVFLCGNDAKAKHTTAELLKSMGWQESSIIDLGEISASRATEQVLPLWIRLMSKYGTPHFNFNIVRK